MLGIHRIVVAAFCVSVALFILLRPADRKPGASVYYGKQAERPLSDALNSTLGFQKIFVINLPSRTDRRDAITLAAALTNLEVNWIDGWAGTDIDEKVLPADSIGKSIRTGNKGSWRAHMDALRTVVQMNLTSALVLEDDADWDVRLKAQLQDLAKATRAYLEHSNAAVGQGILGSPKEAGPEGLGMTLQDARRSLSPTNSPFGDNWDVIWLGHCGTEFPSQSTASFSQSQGPSHEDGSGAAPDLPFLRIVQQNDMTVPSRQHLKPHPLALQDELASIYPDHTRVVHASNGTLCTIGYAVSQQGARKLLWQFGLESFTSGWDLMLRDWCNRLYENKTEDANRGLQEDFQKGGDSDSPRRPPVCVTVQPPIFSHHYGKGSASDITAPGGGFINEEIEMSPYIRLSVRTNMGRLVRGARLPDLVDQWPDEE